VGYVLEYLLFLFSVITTEERSFPTTPFLDLVIMV